MFFGVALRVGGWGVVGRGRKSYLGPAEPSCFSNLDLSRGNKHDSFWFVVSTGYFYILFLWAIVVSDFPPLEIYRHLVLPLSSIAFTANSQADSHFYKYIYLFLLFQVLHSNGLQKKLIIERNRFFFVDYVKINELYTHDDHTSHAVWVEKITAIIISTKKINKNWKILKK